MLGSKASAEPGPFKTDRVPYAVEPMDCISDPLCHELTAMWAAQVGKTECLVNNPVGYFMEQDPSRIGVFMENEDKQKSWSIERLSPMLNDTPCLRDLVSRKGGPDSQNTLDFKDFPGGYLAILNSGSEADLSSRPLRIVLKDEIDKWKMLKAGDPDSLADKRAQNSWNKKIINVSTPRDKETSRIEAKYESSDKRKHYVPCPFCGHEQVLRESQLKFTRPGNTGNVVDDAKYECEKCRMMISHMHKRRMLAAGRWIAEKPFRGHAGFWLSAMYSPWITWKEYAEAFLKMKRQPDTFKTFVNEWRAETWDPQMAAEKDTSPYLTRREHYELVPLGAAYLTAFVDVQGDRLECEVKAWGPGRESWGMGHTIFYGEPLKLVEGSRNLPQAWQDLDAYLAKTWEHESGAMLPISCALIDSGDGNATTIVYRFCRPRRHRNIFPSKGVGGVHEIINRGKIVGREKVRLFAIGANECKNIIFANLEVEPPTVGANGGSTPGYMHFNQNYDEDYFKQLLTSERRVWTTANRTRMQVWQKVSPGARNEAVDLNVGCLASFELLRGDPEARVMELRKLWEVKTKQEVKEDVEANGRSPESKSASKNPLGLRVISKGVRR